MKIENQYIIHFKGLKEGVHNFTYYIVKKFFDDYSSLEIPDGDLRVEVLLIKKAHFLELNIELLGALEVQCDRCLDYFSLPVSYTGQLVVKFSEMEKEPDDEVIYLHPEDHLLDLKHYLYECISLSIPLRKIHPDLPDGSPGCDQDMLDKLREHLI